MAVSQKAQVSATLCWIPFGVGAIGVLLMIVLRHYDPVVDDGMPPAMLPVFYAYLSYCILASSATSTVVVWKQASAQRLHIRAVAFCWASQLLVWGLMGLAMLLNR